MEPNQTWNLLPSKGNYQQMKRELTEWEKIFASNATDKRLISKIYKQLIQLNNRKTNKRIKNWAKDLNRQFSKRNYKWSTGTWKDVQLSLIIRGMKIKTTMSYHLTPVRMAIIKKNTNNKCWQKWDENRTFTRCWWEHKLVTPLWKIVWRFLKKTKNRATIWSGNSTPGYVYKKQECLFEKMQPSVHSSIIHNGQDMEAA